MSRFTAIFSLKQDIFHKYNTESLQAIDSRPEKESLLDENKNFSAPPKCQSVFKSGKDTLTTELYTQVWIELIHYLKKVQNP